MKQKERIVRALEQFSTAMLAALGYLSAAGLVLAAGALLASAGLGSVAPVLRWEPLALAGSLAYDGMMAIIQNLSVVFCVGIAAFLARKEKQQEKQVLAEKHFSLADWKHIEFFYSSVGKLCVIKDTGSQYCQKTVKGSQHIPVALQKNIHRRKILGGK